MNIIPLHGYTTIFFPFTYAACLQVLAIMNKLAINIYVQGFFVDIKFRLIW